MENQYITSISQLNPFKNDATIKARVILRGPVKNWSNAKGEGKLFSFEVADNTGEVKITCFNEQVDQYEPLIEVGKCFFISKALIKTGNPAYTKNPCEMSLTKVSLVQEDTSGQNSDIPQIRYDFIDLSQIQDLEVNSFVDVIAVVSSTGALENITSKKDGRALIKRSVVLVDKSNAPIEITLWGENAEVFDHQEGTVVAIKNARIGSYRDQKNLGNTATTRVDADPPIDLTDELQTWYAENKDGIAHIAQSKGTSTHPTETGTFAQILEQIDEKFNNSDKTPVFMNVRATLVWIKNDDRAPLYYKACPLPNSNKKVEPNDNGNGKPWYCAGLNQYFDSYIPRFILSIALCDTTGSQFVSVFDEEGKKILGCDASDIEALREKGEETTMKSVFEDALYKRYIFKIKASEDTYGDESRVRLQVHTCEVINYERESQTLLNEIDAML